MIDEKTEGDLIKRRTVNDIIKNSSDHLLFKYSDDLFNEMEKRKRMKQAIIYLDGGLTEWKINTMQYIQTRAISNQ